MYNLNESYYIKRIKVNSIKLKNIIAMGFTERCLPRKILIKKSGTRNGPYNIETISVSGYCGGEMEISCWRSMIDGDICNTFNAKDLKKMRQGYVCGDLGHEEANVVVRHELSRGKRQESCGLKIWKGCHGIISRWGSCGAEQGCD